MSKCEGLESGTKYTQSDKAENGYMALELVYGVNNRISTDISEC